MAVVKNKQLDGNGFCGPYFKSIKNRLLTRGSNSGDALRERHGIYRIAVVIDANREEILHSPEDPKFKLCAVVLRLNTAVFGPQDFNKGLNKTEDVINATKKIASVLNLLARTTTYRKTYEAAGMDSTDYKNIKHIGERIDMESTMELISHEFPNMDFDELANDKEAIMQFWGTNKATVKLARNFLLGEPEPVHGLSEDHGLDSDIDEEDTNPKKKQRKSDDSFIAPDDDNEDSDEDGDYCNDSDDNSTSSEETEHNKISNDSSDEDEDLTDPESE